MKQKDMDKCTHVTEGKVVEIKNRGLDFPVIVTVEYEISGIAYQISESKKYSNETIKLGFLPIGQKKIPKLGSIVVGDTVSVSYNPMSPDMAYLTHNVGKINV